MTVFVATEDDGSRWVSEEDYQAAQALATRLQSELDKANGRIGALVEGLDPFAEAQAEALDRYPEAGSEYVAEEARSFLTWDHFCAARALIQEGDAS